MILVTGGGGGIGSALISALIEAGHYISAVDQNVEALAGISATLRSCGKENKFLAIVADITSENECVDAVRKTVSHFGQLHVLINNVGIGVSSIRPDAERNHPKIGEVTTEVWDHFFAVNVRAAMILTRTAVPYILKERWGRIINITTSYRTMLRVLPYGATKAALESMSAIWAKELEDSGITVNVLVPGGPTDTLLIAPESGWPRNEMLQPSVMAPPACWLISDEADGLTGKRITASDWNSTLPGKEAAENAGRPIGWPELAAKARPWQEKHD